jgi:hypothetical protein
MRRPLLRSTLMACTLVAAAACASYRYMRDPTVDLQRSRLEYVENNPGNKYNDDIATGRVRKGMSRLQVRVTWGDPDQIAALPAGSEVWSYQEAEESRGTAIYALQFEGEILSNIDIDRTAAQLQSTDERTRQRREEEPVRTDSDRKPGSR